MSDVIRDSDTLLILSWLVPRGSYFTLILARYCILNFLFRGVFSLREELNELQFQHLVQFFSPQWFVHNSIFIKFLVLDCVSSLFFLYKKIRQALARLISPNFGAFLSQCTLLHSQFQKHLFVSYEETIAFLLVT